MALGKIDANKEVLQKIFSQDFWFVIPEYQRSYVWGEDNITELIDDLSYAFQSKPENDYFIGSLVLKRTRTINYPEYEVLDGQQRLTTFFLIMAVIRDILDNTDYKATLQDMIHQKENKLKKVPSRQRITYLIRDKVEDFIKEFVIKTEGTEQEEQLFELKENNNISISNMANAILTLRLKLVEIEDLEAFTTYLLNNILLIYVSTDNTEDAFRMFTILNDRGVPLTNADIIKSKNIGALDNEKDVKKYAKIWEDIEARFGENYDRFLAFVRTILVKEKARANLLDEFETKIYKENKLKLGTDTFILLQRYTEIYEQIIDLENDDLNNEIRNLITIMKIGFRSEDWIPPLMNYFYKFQLYKLDEFLVKLEYKFAGDWVCGITPTFRLDAMNSILKAIEKLDKDSICQFLNDNNLFGIDRNLLVQNMTSDVYKKQYARYLLLKIEYLRGDNTVHLSKYNFISVEHVLPQNPRNNSQWLKDFDSNERVAWTNKLANLVLVNKRKNSTLSNLDFAEKKEKYLKDRIDVFQGNKIFINQNSVWTPEVLQKRQDEIVQILQRNKA